VAVSGEDEEHQAVVPAAAPRPPAFGHVEREVRVVGGHRGEGRDQDDVGRLALEVVQREVDRADRAEQPVGVVEVMKVTAGPAIDPLLRGRYGQDAARHQRRHQSEQREHADKDGQRDR
jgi:hypothetical protein